MSVDKPVKLLAVRFPEAEMRRIKSLAALQGLSLQEAVHQALEAWAAKLPPEGAPPQPEAAPPLGPRPGPLAGVAVPKPTRPTGAAERTPKRRPGAEAERAPALAGGQAFDLEAVSLAWVSQRCEIGLVKMFSGGKHTRKIRQDLGLHWNPHPAGFRF